MIPHHPDKFGFKKHKATAVEEFKLYRETQISRWTGKNRNSQCILYSTQSQEVQMNWRDFLSFKRMITPIIIKILFWIGIGISVLAGVIVLFGGIIGGISGDGLGRILAGLVGGPLVTLLGIISARIYSELLILVFQINETLTDIKNLLGRE
jgi:hypothetical protein